LGADEVIDYRTTDFTEAVEDADIVFDSVADGARSLQVLKPGGVLVTILEHVNAELERTVQEAGRRFAGVSVEPDYWALEQIAELVDAGKLRPTIAETLPLEEVGKAHELVASGDTVGKVVLTVD
ncbi:zinc-binding dehydrogenase, partial [Nocardia sp. NPDC046763]|uniref:zinc-binding dehydrogenase n=1 Tax=Nocardia sp. NPDC046763 TaxID=3155256 RepID=UPI0033CFAA68